jgi:hypothetical protein
MAIGTTAAILGGAVLGLGASAMQASSQRSAASKQADAAQYAADQQREMFNLVNEQQAPYREAGYGALTRIGELLPSLTTPITAEEIRSQPGYEFAIEQGTGAARANMNVGGGGSNVDRAAQKFAIDYTVGTALPSAMAQRTSIYNTLAGIAGIGQTGTQQTGAAAMSAGTNIGQAAIGGASALGAGQIGSANAYAQGLSGIGNAGFMYSLLNRQGAGNALTAMGPTIS